MKRATVTSWNHLEGKSSSAYRQLFVKGTRIAARLLYGLYANEQDPMTPGEIADAYNLPLEAVEEAIAYCQTDPPEIQADWQMEEASISDRVSTNPDSLHPKMTEPPHARN